MKETAIIILNWNNTNQTIKLIKSINKYEKQKKVRIIVVDNNSEIEEKEKLKNYSKKNNFCVLKEKSKFKDEYLEKNFIIFLKKNYGYAKGNNYGLKLAYEIGCDFSIISNNDILFERSVIAELQNQFSDDNIALIGPKILDKNNNKQGPFKKPNLITHFLIPMFYPFFSIFKKYQNLFQKNEDTVSYPYRLMGCFFMLKTDVAKEIGFFDENTFLYAEELILAEKLIKNKYKTKYFPNIYVKHLHGYSTKYLSKKKKFILNLESDLYYFKNYRDYNFLKLFLIKLGKKTYLYIWLPIFYLLKKLRDK